MAEKISKQRRSGSAPVYDEFVYRFDVYDGSESSQEVYDAQVVEYEFVNQGSSMVVINDGMRLYPAFSGIQPNSWKGSVNNDEMDVTVYKFRFEPLDFVVTQVIDGSGFPIQFIHNEINPVDPEEGVGTLFNRLLVVSKVKASVETPNP